MFPAGEYDKVIDVDLGDGVYRKLPCNNGANYLDVADRFCAREHLGRSYVEQIVQFLRQNTLPYATREIDPDQDPKPKSDAQLMNSFFGKKKCAKIPCTQNLLYDQVKLDGCKKKILEFQAELNVLDSNDLIYFESLIKVLASTGNYHRTEVSP